jgi:hypothetical protein
MPNFHVITGTPAPDTPAEKGRRDRVASAPATCCHRCGGMTFTQVTTGSTVKNGRMVGGTKQVICAVCQTKGHLVVIG